MAVTLHTSQGDLKVEVFCDTVHKTSENFLALCASGYYNGTVFHRNIKGFMIQTGDPEGDGTGGSSIWGKDFEDEFSSKRRHGAFALSMANAGPNTNGSQFFITTSTPEWLNDKHTIFGKVVEGYDKVKKIEGVEKGAGDKPVEDQKILKAYIAE